MDESMDESMNNVMNVRITDDDRKIWTVYDRPYCNSIILLFCSSRLVMVLLSSWSAVRCRHGLMLDATRHDRTDRTVVVVVVVAVVVQTPSHQNASSSHADGFMASQSAQGIHPCPHQLGGSFRSPRTRSLTRRWSSSRVRILCTRRVLHLQNPISFLNNVYIITRIKGMNHSHFVSCFFLSHSRAAHRSPLRQLRESNVCQIVSCECGPK
jgi:hypothetical protein